MSDSLNPLIRQRRSGCIIAPDKPVESSKTEALLEAARWAPSCSNQQSWRFIVIENEALPSVKETLSRGNRWALHAPLIIAAITKPDLGCRITGRDYFTLDLGLAIENMLLQGIHMGLVMHPIAGFDENKIKLLMDIPPGYRVYALVVAGYPGSFDGADSEIVEKESAPRNRKPVGKIASREKWGFSEE